MSNKSSILKFKTRIDIQDKDRESSAEILNQMLAALTDLYSQVKFAHWNVRGDEFISLHKLFDELAEEVEDAIDVIAERVSSLGGVALGTIRIASKSSALPEFPANTFMCSDVVKALADRYAIAARMARKGIDEAMKRKDMSTADVFTETSRMLDHSLYFLDAHLQGEEEDV